MSIIDASHRLANSARRLNAGSDSLNEAIERIDGVLGQLNVGLEYLHPRPVAENTSVDDSGKRVIELVYLGYLKVDRHYHLAVRTTKVLESRLQLATHSPGKVIALLRAPRKLRFAAVDALPELVTGLAAQVDEMVAAMQRRQETADSVLRDLEAIASAEQSSEGWSRHRESRPTQHEGSSASMSIVPPAASQSDTSVGSRPPASTEFYPGTESEAPVVPAETTARIDVGRKTVPIGSGSRRQLQQERS